MLLIVVVIQTLFLLFLAAKRQFVPDLSAWVELSTMGYVEVEVDARVEPDRGIVVLRSDCWSLTAYTEPTQAESIIRGLERRIGFRPNTHDIIHSIFRSFGVEVLMAKVVDIKNNTFIGRLILRHGNKALSVDSRPSDATAIAIRANAPIYIKEELLKAYGSYIC